MEDYTKRILRGMMTENTGGSLFDSGGKDNRAWQRNQKLVHEEGEDVFDRRPEVLGFEFNENGSWDGAVDVYHYLLDNFVASAAWNRMWRMFDNQEGDGYGSYSVMLDAFCERVGLRVSEGGYTYNTDCLLSQGVVWSATTWKRNSKRGGDGGPTIIQLHNGCDARGGFTEPKFFEPLQGEIVYFDPGIALCCTGLPEPALEQLALIDMPERGWMPHVWHTRPRCTEWGEFENTDNDKDKLSGYEFVFEPDEDWLYENGLGNSRLVIHNGIVHCPLCGGVLKPYMEV